MVDVDVGDVLLVLENGLFYLCCYCEYECCLVIGL